MSKPSRAMSVRKRPSGPTRSGTCAGGSAGLASTRTRCSPTARLGIARARRTASAAPGLATIRLAAERMPVRCAISTASLTASARPKSSAVTISRLMRRLPVGAQEGEELDAFAQAALHHLRAPDHLADDRGDLGRAEIEAAVEVLHRVEDLAVAETRIVQRRDLHAALVDQLGVLGVEPAVLHRLLVQERARIRRGERDLDGVWVDLGGEADRLLDRLLRFPGEPQDEGAVDRDAELVAILGEALGHVDQHALLDVVQDLLVARLVADQQKPQAVVAHHLERLAPHIGLGVARPGDAELAQLLCDRLGARRVIGEGVVVEEELLHLRERLHGIADLVNHVADAAGAIAMTA